MLGNGAAELFYVLLHTIKPKGILIPVPSFSEYERAAIATGAAVDYFPISPENGFSIDRDKLIASAKNSMRRISPKLGCISPPAVCMKLR